MWFSLTQDEQVDPLPPDIIMIIGTPIRPDPHTPSHHRAILRTAMRMRHTAAYDCQGGLPCTPCS